MSTLEDTCNKLEGALAALVIIRGHKGVPSVDENWRCAAESWCKEHIDTLVELGRCQDQIFQEWESNVDPKHRKLMECFEALVVRAEAIDDPKDPNRGQ